MVGGKYKLLGTDNIFEITGDNGQYWVITITSPKGQEVGVIMAKEDLSDSISQGSLI